MPCQADKIVKAHHESDTETKFNIIPFAFYTEEFEFGAGLAMGWTGHQHGQANFYAGGFYTTNNSYAAVFRASQTQVYDRLFLNTTLIRSRQKEQRSYIRNNPAFPDEEGGSNDSSEDNFIQAPGKDHSYEFDFFYLLPLGDGKKNIIKTYELANGILVSEPSGGQRWDPRTSGRSYIRFIPFYRTQVFNQDTGDLAFNTNGIKLSFEYDNRDFPDNPATGSHQLLRFTRDFGWGDSSDSWATIDFEYSKYFSLGESDSARQRVIAFDFWTANTPTWERVSTPDGIIDIHRPPPYMGATLGGINRLRAYPGERFNDKAAVYYSMEYRYTPKSNPLGKVSLLNPLTIDWWQFVGFVEIGRVAPEWDLETLHKDMQYDIGVGLRAMTMRSIVRLDAAFSDESWQVYAMVGHPF